MILAGQQPRYLPFVGQFYKILKCDKFIIVDHVQYEKKEFHNRNKIRTAQGWMWLTVPVITKGRFHQKMNQVEINNQIPWQKKHWKAIYFSYKNTPFFDKYADFFKDTYEQKWSLLSELDNYLLKKMLKLVNIDTEILLSSDFNFQKGKNQLLIEMCKATGADTYLSGSQARDYVDEQLFKNANLNHMFSDFEPLPYRQRFKPFIPYLSFMDLMFNHGDKSKELLLTFNKDNKDNLKSKQEQQPEKQNQQ